MRRMLILPMILLVRSSPTLSSTVPTVRPEALGIALLAVTYIRKEPKMRAAASVTSGFRSVCLKSSLQKVGVSFPHCGQYACQCAQDRCGLHLLPNANFGKSGGPVGFRPSKPPCTRDVGVDTQLRGENAAKSCAAKAHQFFPGVHD
eukprot:1868810-Amphidinium_carterae.1